MTKFELFGTASCPYTREMREWLEWRRRDFIEYDVEREITAIRESGLPHADWLARTLRAARPEMP